MNYDSYHFDGPAYDRAIAAGRWILRMLSKPVVSLSLLVFVFNLMGGVSLFAAILFLVLSLAVAAVCDWLLDRLIDRTQRQRAPKENPDAGFDRERI